MNLLLALTNESVPHLLAYTLTYPFVPFGLVLLAFGIAYMRTHEIRIGLVAGFLTAWVMYALSPTLIDPTILVGITVPTMAAVLYDLFHPKSHNSTSPTAPNK